MTTKKFSLKRIIKHILLIILAIVLLIFAFVTEELVRAILIGGYILPPKIPHYEGLKYYQDEDYKDFKRGEEASLYLPKYDEIENAEYIDFLYLDQTRAETIFTNFGHTIAVGIRYEENAFNAEREKILQQGTEIKGFTYISDACLVAKEQKGRKLYLYYFVLFSEEYKTVTHVVYFDDILLTFDHVCQLLNVSHIDYTPFMRTMHYRHLLGGQKEVQ